MIRSSTTTAPNLTLLCPSCGAWFTNAREALIIGNRSSWEVYRCQNQDCLALILIEFAKRSSGDFLDGHIVYPYSVATTIEGVPEKIIFNYDQAVRSYSAGAYNAATVMARACVEAVAKDKKAKGQNLYEKLKWLEEKREISPRLYEWAMTIKDWGNEAIHELDPIDVDTADYIVKFTWELIEHLYVKPAEFGKIRREPPT